MQIKKQALSNHGAPCICATRGTKGHQYPVSAGQKWFLGLARNSPFLARRHPKKSARRGASVAP